MIKIKWEQTQKQNEAWQFLIDKTTEQLIFGGGAGGAKSFLGCAWLICMCGQYPNTRWLMGRSKLKNLKQTTLVTFFEICSKWGIKEGIDYKYNSIEGEITWANGSIILLKDLFAYPSDPNFDSLGSLEITGAFIDEVNQISFKAFDTVNARRRYKLDEYGLIPKTLGTCNPSKKWVYSEFYKPFVENRLEVYKKFVPALAKDNPFISKHYIETLQKIKDKATRERLLNGNWEYDDDPSCLLAFDVINDLFTNHAEKSKEKYIIGDVARKGRDRMVISYWEGLQMKEIHVLDYETKKDTAKSSKWILDYAKRKQVRLSCVLLDEDGVGGGVVDQVGCKGFINNASPIQPEEAKEDSTKKVNYANLKTQCAYRFSQLAEEGKIGIDDIGDSEIKELMVEDLEQLKQKDADKDGKISLVGKDQVKEAIGRSPDFGDTLIMRMFFELDDEAEPSISFLN